MAGGSSSSSSWGPSPAAVKALVALLGLGVAAYIVGPPLYWHVAEALGQSTGGCPACACDCDALPLLQLPEGRRQALDLAATSSALARLMGIGWSMHAGDGGSPRVPSSPARTRHPTTSSIANHQRPYGGFAFYPLPHTNALLPATMARTGELSSSDGDGDASWRAAIDSVAVGGFGYFSVAGKVSSLPERKSMGLWLAGPTRT